VVVIKLGGSLLESGALGQCLDTIDTHYKHAQVIVVQGGGPFAELVRFCQRCWHYDDRTAHQMAILAMQQTALVCKALKARFMLVHKIGDIKSQLQHDKSLIRSPDINELDRAGVAAGWDVTSDSLAAWLAGTVSASQLILVKSIQVDEALTPQQLVANGIVDQEFISYLPTDDFAVSIVGKDQFCGLTTCPKQCFHQGLSL